MRSLNFILLSEKQPFTALSLKKNNYEKNNQKQEPTKATVLFQANNKENNIDSLTDKNKNRDIDKFYHLHRATISRRLH